MRKENLFMELQQSNVLAWIHSVLKFMVWYTEMYYHFEDKQIDKLVSASLL